MTRPAALALAVLILAGAWSRWRGWTAITDGLPSALQARVGQAAPAFDLPGLNSQPVRLDAMRGRPVLVNFWTTWCTACRQEMPQIERFYQDNRTELNVVGIDMGEPRATLAAFIHRHSYSWRFALDGNEQVSDRYGVRYIPTSFWLDGHGVIRAVYTGPMTEALMRLLLRVAAGAG